MNRIAALAFVCALAASAAQAKKSTTPPDYDFGCDVSTFSPGTWEAKGMNDLSRYKSKFKLLKSVSSYDTPSTLFRNCKSFPKTSFFVKSSGGGGVTRADVVVATEDVKVYRAFSKSPFACGITRPAAKWGSWWSVVPLPGASMKEDYRASVGVCSSWNDFSMMVECTLKAGSVVAIGPTQAADCGSDNAASTSNNGCKGKTPKTFTTRLPAKPTHQLYLNTYGRSESDISEFLTNCSVRSW
ncbi:MAG: hypothetical protein JST92_13270 [Deltaproteobacteria bacterium]|nr:hypothetical protein [Deltaproteobacteria bacterium]